MYTLFVKSKLKEPNMILPKMLVTGCGGNVGKMIDSVWQTVFDHDLIGFDRSSENIQKNYPWRNAVLCTHYHTFDMVFQPEALDHLLKTEKIEKIAHLASVPRHHANSDLDLAKRYNIQATQVLIDSIKRNCDLKNIHVIFGSCMSVYGDRTSNPAISVTDKPAPNAHDYFAQTKLEAEHLLKDSGISHTILRFAPVCDPLNWWVDLDPNFFYFGLDQKIEWITARDSAKAIRSAMYKSEQLNGKTLNIGGGKNLTLRHREFMKEILEARGASLKSVCDVSAEAFANKGQFGGHFVDSDESNSMLGYRMQPIDTAYLRQLYRFPFPMRWLNRRFNAASVANSQYAMYSHVYQAQKEKDVEFLAKHFDAALVEPKEVMEKRVNEELEVEFEERELHKRQLANMLKKQKEDFEEAKMQRDIRDAIERKWRKRREMLIEMGKDPNEINLDEIDKLEEEDRLREERGEKFEEPVKVEKELTEEEKIRLKEDEEDAAEREKSRVGY